MKPYHIAKPKHVMGSHGLASRVVHGSSLCPTQTLPKKFEWIKMEPKTDLEDSPNWLVLISLGVKLYWSISGFVTKAEI